MYMYICVQTQDTLHKTHSVLPATLFRFLLSLCILHSCDKLMHHLPTSIISSPTLSSLPPSTLPSSLPPFLSPPSFPLPPLPLPLPSLPYVPSSMLKGCPSLPTLPLCSTSPSSISCFTWF